MKSKILRTSFVTLGGLTLALALVRCSPNASSINKALLHQSNNTSADRVGDGPTSINIDQSLLSHQSHAFATKFMSRQDYRKWMQELSDENIRVSLSSHSDSFEQEFRELKEKGKTEVRVESDEELTPDEALIVLANNENSSEALDIRNCHLGIRPTSDHHWEIALTRNAECKDGDRILRLLESVTVTFHPKSPNPNQSPGHVQSP